MESTTVGMNVNCSVCRNPGQPPVSVLEVDKGGPGTSTCLPVFPHCSTWLICSAWLFFPSRLSPKSRAVHQDAFPCPGYPMSCPVALLIHGAIHEH